MRKPLYLLAAALLAMTFCADRALAATPALRPEVVQLAEKLVSRLSESFSRTAACIAIFPQRQSINSAVALRPLPPLADSQPLVPQPTSPFQFRLPPPTV
jgi:hypothetical protein